MNIILKTIQIILCVPLVLSSVGQSMTNGADTSTDDKPFKEAAFAIETPGYDTFKTSWLGHVFKRRRNCIIRLAPELDGLTGIKRQYDPTSSDQNALELRFTEPVSVLIGLFNSQDQMYRQLASNKQSLVIQNAITITGLPPVDVYALPFIAGTHVIQPPGSDNYIILGVIKGHQSHEVRDAAMPDGRLWDPFIVEGYYDDNPLFSILDGPDTPVIDEGMPGTEGILGGFEGGACVKVGSTYHMFPTERAGEEGTGSYYDRVKTRIGHWTSQDAIHWERQSTIYQASGHYAVTDNDNPFNDRRGAIWSYMPIYNEEKDRWYGYYLAYTVHREIEPNHSFGRIWRCESVVAGKEGIGGPYRDAGVIMEPGLNTQLWEGRQGVDSFFPFKAGSDWLAFYGGAYPFETRSDYPAKGKKGAWYVGLAKAPALEGPWTRMDTTVNPVTSMHPYFIENPIVYKLTNEWYIAIFDGGPEAWGLHLPNMIGFALSRDGYHWSEAHYLPIETKVKKWWNIMRTPVCLIPEGNDVYTILYAAIDASRRFHPMGMVKVRLNRKALTEQHQPLP